MQVVIPDLDDKQLFAPAARNFDSPVSSRNGLNHADATPNEQGPASSQQLQSAVGSIDATSWQGTDPTTPSYQPSQAFSSSNPAFAFPASPAKLAFSSGAGPFRGAALGQHGRKDSANSDSSTSGFGGLSNRPPLSVKVPFGTSGSDFPASNSLSGSLRSPIRAFSSSDRIMDYQEQWPPTPSYAGLDVPELAADPGDITAGYRSGLSTPRPPAQASHSSFDQLPSSPAYAMTSNASLTRSAHAHNDSLSSSNKASNHAASTSGSSRYHHVPTASYQSDSHRFAGAGNSTTSSAAYPYKTPGSELPPVPPLPYATDYAYADMPVTPGGHTNQAAFQLPNAMESTTSLDMSDFGSPYRPAFQQLRDDTRRRPSHYHRYAEDMSSGEYGSIAHTQQKQPKAPASPTKRLSALAVSTGVERHGQLPSGIGRSDPQAPADYALNILMSRFIAIASAKMRHALESAHDQDPATLTRLGKADEALYASLCESLAHISKRNAGSVVKSLFQWKKITIDADVGADVIRRHLGSNQATQNSNVSTREIAMYLNRRKELVVLYLSAEILNVVAKTITRESFGEAQAIEFEEKTFDMLLACTREKDKDRTLPRPISVLRECCFEAVSQLIGELSRTRFVSVSDRFVEILEQSTKAPAAKNVEDLLVAAVQSLRHLKITIYPMELFEEGADFIYILSRHYASCHGFRVKSAFANALTHLMVPVAQSASAEVNHPTWVKAIDTIWPRMTAMAAKPRYWSVAYPLHVCLLAASPEQKLTTNWFPCVEVGVVKLKDRVNRAVVLNAAVRLLWAYAFRCHESHTNTTKKLEAFFRIWFPPNRRSYHPSEASPEPFIMMIHLALYRHFEFGKDLVLTFLCHSDLGGTTLSLQPDILTGQRTTAAIRAMLLTLDAYVKGESPAFPGGPNFGRFDFDTLPPGCGDELPEHFKFPRQEIGETQAQFNDLVSKIALLCDHQISDMTVFDSRTHLFSRSSANAAANANERAILERDEYTLRYHQDANLTAAYLRDNQAYCDLLRACFDSWPRCISSNISFASLLAVLFRAHFSADPDLSRASSRTLLRIAKQRQGGSSAVVSGFMRYVFRMDTVFWEIHAKQVLLMPKVEVAIRFWIEILQIWLEELRSHTVQTDQAQPGLKGIEMERTSAWALIDEVEAYALFLLCSASRSLRSLGMEVLGLVALLDETFVSPSRKLLIEDAKSKGDEEEPTRVIHLLNLPCQQFLDVNDPHLSSHQINHLAKYKSPDRSTALKQIAESEKEVEQGLWSRALPTFLRMSLERFPTTVAVFRSYITNRVLEMDHVAVYAADISNRAPTNTVTSTTLNKMHTSASTTSLNSSASIASLREAAATVSPSEYTLMAQHWRFYILALCTTTTSTDGSRGGVVGNHRRKTSEPENGERMISARDLFQKMIPFLASDNDIFQEAVVFALGNTNENHYTALLDTMQSVSGTLTEDFKVRSVARNGLRRNRRLDRLRTALGQVLQLTSSHMEANNHLKNPKVVTVIHTWVKETFAFLIDRDIRQDWEFHRLRRYFSGVTTNFFNGLVNLEVAETYFPFDVRLRMFRVFRDWHSYSTMSEDGRNKLANLLSAAADQQRDDRAKERAVKTLNYETQALSYHAGCAMAALCQGAISVTGRSAPITGSSLEAGSLLAWLRSLFTTSDEKNHELARKAMRALLIFNDQNSTLISGAVDRCITEPDRVIGKRSFFVTMAEVVMEKDDFAMPLHSVFCLGLIKLSHPDSSIRRKSLCMLDCSARRFNDACSVIEFEVGVSSSLPAIYLRAQREVSATLAVHFDGLKTAILSEFTQRMHAIDSIRRATTLGLLSEWLLGLEFHVPSPGVSLYAKPEAFYRTYLNLCNLFCLTFNYGDEHTFELQEAWCSLVNVSEDSQNVHAVIRFLIDQGLRFRSPDVALCARRVVSCFSHTPASPRVFDELCALIEPGGMIQVPSSPPAPLPDLDHRHLYRANLERLFPDLEAGLTFSPGLLALLYVGEMMYERRTQLGANLAMLLHAIFMHIDSRSAFVRSQAVRLLEQTLRCTISMTPDSDDAAAAKKVIVDLLARRTFASWAADPAQGDIDTQQRMSRSLFSTVRETLALVSPCFPEFQQDWGSVALLWAASNPIRHMACRSFQTFRALRPTVTSTMMVTILGRLADTASDHKSELHSFTLEVLYALNLVVSTCEAFNEDFLAQTWWATLACLSTVNEEEFAESVRILEVLVTRLDVGSSDAIYLLLQRCPDGWEGEVGLLRILVSRGLRSSITSSATFSLMAKLAKCVDTALIDIDNRSMLGYLFVAALPWFLQLTEDRLNTANSLSGNKSAARSAIKKTFTEAINTSAAVLSTSESAIALEMAADLAMIAERLGMGDLERVVTSISKCRFRTKDDLVRQAVSCIRTHYLSKHGSEMRVLLLGVVLNQKEWMRRQAMEILKIFFQAIDTRHHAALSNFGSELLMPLLRQLSTPLSSQALEVLDEPIVVHGGPAASQVLRMSLLWGNAPRSGHTAEQVNEASIFGPPQESGWAVANPQDMTTQTRINLQALMKMCERTLDIVPTGNNVHFVVDDAYDGAVEAGGNSGRPSMDDLGDVGRSSTEDPPSSSLGDIVNQLHDLSSFFGDEPMSKSHQISVMRRDSRLDRSASKRLGLESASRRADAGGNGGSIGRGGSYYHQVSPNPTIVPETHTANGSDRSMDGVPRASPSRNLAGVNGNTSAWISTSSLDEIPPTALAPSLPVAPRAAEMVPSRSHARIAKILARSASYDLTNQTSADGASSALNFSVLSPARTFGKAGSRSSIRYRSDSLDQSSDAGSSQQHQASPSPSPSTQMRSRTYRGPPNLS